MKYDVNVQDDGMTIAGESGLSKKQAENKAVELAAEYPNCLVFVEWFRKSDGQHGYLNQDGNHAITGEAWEA